MYKEWIVKIEVGLNNCNNFTWNLISVYNKNITIRCSEKFINENDAFFNAQSFVEKMNIKIIAKST